MKSIFNADDNAVLISRINSLKKDTPAQWGKMNVAQMMAHCQASMNLAFGNTKNHRHWIGIFFWQPSQTALVKSRTA